MAQLLSSQDRMHCIAEWWAGRSAQAGMRSRMEGQCDCGPQQSGYQPPTGLLTSRQQPVAAMLVLHSNWCVGQRGSKAVGAAAAAVCGGGSGGVVGAQLRAVAPQGINRSRGRAGVGIQESTEAAQIEIFCACEGSRGATCEERCRARAERPAACLHPGALKPQHGLVPHAAPLHRRGQST